MESFGFLGIGILEVLFRVRAIFTRLRGQSIRALSCKYPVIGRILLSCKNNKYTYIQLYTFQSAVLIDLSPLHFVSRSRELVRPWRQEQTVGQMESLKVLSAEKNEIVSLR